MSTIIFMSHYSTRMTGTERVLSPIAKFLRLTELHKQIDAARARASCNHRDSIYMREYELNKL